jgi:hypothetical protein
LQMHNVADLFSKMPWFIYNNILNHL